MCWLENSWKILYLVATHSPPVLDIYQFLMVSWSYRRARLSSMAEKVKKWEDFFISCSFRLIYFSVSFLFSPPHPLPLRLVPFSLVMETAQLLFDSSLQIILIHETLHNTCIRRKLYRNTVVVIIKWNRNRIAISLISFIDFLKQIFTSI